MSQGEPTLFRSTPSGIGRTRVSGFTRWRVFWRTLFIQAGFTSEGMQSLGVVFALMPALEKLYPDMAERQRVIERHLEPFNTHPYAGAAIVGAIVHEEARASLGEVDPKTIGDMKTALMGPLAALGDGFYWLSLRPAVGGVAAATVPWLGAWSVLVYLALYNIVHIVSRGSLFLLGLRHGAGLINELAKWRVPMWNTRVRRVGTAATAGLAAYLAVKLGSELQHGSSPWFAFAGVMLAFLCVLGAERVNKYVMFYVVAALCCVASALF